jgi:hypothetical protein
MKWIISILACLFAIYITVEAQPVNISKTVKPGEVVVGDELLITITIHSNATRNLVVVDTMPEAFDVLSISPTTACSLRIQGLTNTRIVKCELVVDLSESIHYSAKANAAGVYFLPEATVITEGGEEVVTKSNVRLTVGASNMLPITEPPAPIQTPTTPAPTPTEGFNPISTLSRLIGLIADIISKVFPESIRFIVLGLLLFFMVILIFIIPFYFYLRK